MKGAPLQLPESRGVEKNRGFRFFVVALPQRLGHFETAMGKGRRMPPLDRLRTTRLVCARISLHGLIEMIDSLKELYD